MTEMSTYKAARKRADDTARLLREALKSLGVREADVRDIRGTVTASGYSRVVVGALSLQAADKLADSLIEGQLRERKARQRAGWSSVRDGLGPRTGRGTRAVIHGENLARTCGAITGSSTSAAPRTGKP
ncbi:hypothetical protein GCM10010507_56360 [Streptomyces cinnamoneus]|uniref:Uncharacterized protein n=1 Tax=Streptomyces cinnamoneus TaxID=53446 RepID=A0A918TYK7_STRCJ|nr:hypothetical protein GCM10010507_56360 [Streptomyces cinnamoneus]